MPGRQLQLLSAPQRNVLTSHGGVASWLSRAASTALTVLVGRPRVLSRRAVSYPLAVMTAYELPDETDNVDVVAMAGTAKDMLIEKWERKNGE